ncbi:SRPBCC domain-containing protein [bacterium]|nr:SRPBCC domain-containing protein [bacterium]
MKSVDVTIEINTSPSTIISAFTDYKMLKAWWGVERALIEKRNGGLYTLTWNISEKGFGYVTTGIIKNCIPDRLLEIDRVIYLNPERDLLGPMSLTAEVVMQDGHSQLQLCQTGYQSGPDWDWYYEAVKQAWPAVVQNLKKYLENSTPPQQPID